MTAEPRVIVRPAAPILAVIAYGSLARGDADEFSDRDVCVVYDGIEDDAVEVAQAICRARFIDSPDLSLYAVSDFAEMVGAGSLFGWHLQLEGVFVAEAGPMVRTLLGSLRPYSQARRDVAEFRKLLTDSRAALARAGPNAFDLALLYTIARNTAMVLSVQGGQPTFGRTSVFRAAGSIYGGSFDFRPDVYAELLRWKLWHARAVGYTPPDPSARRLLAMTDHVVDLVRFAEEVCFDRPT